MVERDRSEVAAVPTCAAVTAQDPNFTRGDDSPSKRWMGKSSPASIRGSRPRAGNQSTIDEQARRSEGHAVTRDRSDLLEEFLRAIGAGSSAQVGPVTTESRLLPWKAEDGPRAAREMPRLRAVEPKGHRSGRVDPEFKSVGDERDCSVPGQEKQRPLPVQREPGHFPLPHTAIVRPVDEAARIRRQPGDAPRESPLPSGSGERAVRPRVCSCPTSVGRRIGAFPLC